jgi:hypothetical protein
MKSRLGTLLIAAFIAALPLAPAPFKAGTYTE